MLDKGSKQSETYKGATAAGTNVDLVGQLVLSDTRTLSFKGNVFSKNKTQIGSFDYNNPNGLDTTSGMYMGSFNQTVTITDEQYAQYQEEATTLMVNAVTEFPKTTTTPETI